MKYQQLKAILVLIVPLACFTQGSAQKTDSVLKPDTRISLEAGYELSVYPGEVFTGGVNFKTNNHEFGVKLKHLRTSQILIEKRFRNNAYQDAVPMTGASINYRLHGDEIAVFSDEASEDQFFRPFFTGNIEYYAKNNAFDSDSLMSHPLQYGRGYVNSNWLRTGYSISGNKFHSIHATVGYGFEFRFMKQTSFVFAHHLLGGSLKVLETTWDRENPPNSETKHRTLSHFYADVSYFSFNLLYEF